MAVASTYKEFKDVEIIKESENAVLLRLYDWEDYWIPYSQIEDNGEVIKEGEKLDQVYISTWICKEKGLL